MTAATEPPSPQSQATAKWTGTQAYLLAIITLVLGIAIGYFLRGSQHATPAAKATIKPAASPAAAPEQQAVRAESLKRMADKQAEPLLAQVKDNPKDVDSLVKLGNIYYDTQNFHEAVDFYSKGLAVRDSSQVRTDLGTAYWYLGDADSAIREFQAALRLDSNNANAYFNLGVVKWEGKMDAKGAVETWQTLLRKHPNHQNRKQVERMIARAKQHANLKPGSKTDKPAM